MPSLKTNLVANYTGQIYLALIGFVMLPVYVGYMGAEAYGLVGFFTMLQAWFLLLDLGLTPTLARELSRFRAGTQEPTQLAARVRTLEWLLGGLGLTCALVVGLAARWIARDWLKAQHLAPAELSFSVLCMGVILGLRGWSSLYRGGLAGLERMVILNVAAVVLATLRSVGVVAVLIYWTVLPHGFFAYQAALAALELVVMGTIFYRSFPMQAAGLAPSWQSLRDLVGLSGGMAFLAGLWLVLSQTDRLVLSWVLDLRAFGFFSVAVALAGAISFLAAPISQALQPRLIFLAAQGRRDELVMLYRVSTQVTCAIVFAATGVLVCFAEPLLQAWTGNAEVARAGARILPLYAAGNAVVTLLALAFLVQFAFGQVRWQVIGSCLFGAIWIPGAYLAASRAGAVGTGWVWLTGNLAFFLGWLPYVHHRLLPGLWARWLFGDVGVILLVVGAGLAVASRLDLSGVGRGMIFTSAAGIAGLLLLAGLIAGSETRRLLLEHWRRYVWVKAS